MEVTMTIPKQEKISTTAFPMELSKITQSDVFRSRERDDEDIIETYTEVFTQYREANERGENPEYPFPPVWVRKHGDETYTLIAGFHRDTAARRAELSEIQVKVFTGTEVEAIWFAMRDNRTNGLRLSNGDIRFCIEKALIRFPDLTAGAIAKELGCGRSYAYEIENELSASGQLPEVEQRIGADGKVRSAKKKVDKKSGSKPTTGKPNGKGSDATPEPVDDLSVKDRMETDTLPNESVAELPTFEMQIDEVIATLDGLLEKHPLREERVRILDRVNEWERKQRVNLQPQPTEERKPSRELSKE
jgi:hypothetical protein